jgi:hypothetical protein
MSTKVIRFMAKPQVMGYAMETSIFRYYRWDLKESGYRAGATWPNSSFSLD